jgi:predicted PurR-regulated permease PerM
VFAVVVVALGLVAAFVYAVTPPMAQQFHTLVHDFPGHVTELQDRWAALRRIGDRFHLTSHVRSVLASLPDRLSKGVFAAAGRLPSTLLSTLTVAVLAVYFLADLPRLRRGVVRLFPRTRRAEFSRVLNVMVDKVGDYTSGNILISLVAGLAAFAALSALRVPFAVPLAFVVAVTDLIPTIGATLGAVICVLVALPTTRLWPNTVLVAVFFVLYQQLENYLIAPRIMRNKIQLRPGAVLLASLVGAAALGLIGALMAIPVAAAVTTLLSERLQDRDDFDGEPVADGNDEGTGLRPTNAERDGQPPD